MIVEEYHHKPTHTEYGRDSTNDRAAEGFIERAPSYRRLYYHYH